MTKRVLILSLILTAIISDTAPAVHLGASEDGKPLPWSRKMAHPLDQPVNEKCPDTPFLMNLGPTGIRAMITPENPKAFLVKFVFQDSYSPAKGLIKPDDLIVGAGGKDFTEPHGFHRKSAGSRGWQGPPFELAGAIEDSQGSDGKLTLIVLEGGSKNKRKNVTLQLKPVGKFSPTWPWNCPRSDQLLKDLCDFMFDGNLDRMKRHHYMQGLLALWASGDKRAMPLVKAKAESLMKSRPDFKSGGMGQTWMTGYNGIFLGEYYNATKDSGVKTAAENFAPFYEYAQFENGSYGHRSAISFLASGNKPYASMAACGGICMLAQSTFRANGLAYSEVAYERSHQGHLRSAGRDGGAGIAYGFAGEKQSERITDHAVLKLESMKGIKEPKPRPWWPELGGKGLPIEGGLAACGKYTVVWPTSSDPRWSNGCIDWLKNEKDKVIIKYGGNEGDTVTAWRYLPDVVVKEPTTPYNTTPNGAGHQAGSAPGALAHFISNKDNKSWGYLGKHMANGCALSPRMLWDGHADAVIHAFFGALAAFRADEKNLRSWLDYTKTWIILSETHEPRAKGGLVDQPFGCQRNSTCSIACGRTAYTHVAIAILSVPKRKLLITGADYEQPAGPTTAKPYTPSTSSYTPAESSTASSSTDSTPDEPAPSAPPAAVLRKARALAPDKADKLESTLQLILAKLSDAGALKDVPLSLSPTRAKVYVKGADADGKLTLQVTTGSDTARLSWRHLTAQDVATLAIYVAEIKPDSGDAQAIAGVYLESLGNVTKAEEYYEKAGPASRKKLEALFN